MGLQHLKRTLSLWDLICLGVGTVVGVGVFVLAGITAAKSSGPAVIVAFAAAGVAALFTALSYAEMASNVVSEGGGSYNYANVAFGRLAGWLVGWTLLFVYSFAIAYLASGWSGYFTAMLDSMGVHLPAYLSRPYYEPGGLVSVPSLLIILFLAWISWFGTKRSVKFNVILVVIKFSTIALFVVVSAKYFQLKNWHPFMPYGWSGVFQGAALVFNAFVGFDIVTAASAETKDPQRMVPVGLILTFLICTFLYILIAGILTGMVPYTTLNNSAALSNALISLHLNWAASLIASGAIFGITAVIFGFFFALTRLSYAMSNDRMIPKYFSQVHIKYFTPHRAIIASTILTMILAVCVPLLEAVKLINIGSLFTYMLVCAGVIRLRITQPNRPRSFKLPFGPLIPILGIGSCFYLTLNISWGTWLGYAAWIGLGFVMFYAVVKKKLEATALK